MELLDVVDVRRQRQNLPQLVLVRANNDTGFKYVFRYNRGYEKDFSAKLRYAKLRYAPPGGRIQKKYVYFGNFATAEEAALEVARFLGSEGVAEALAPPAPEPASMTAGAELQTAEA